MISSHLKQAVRLLKRQRVYTFINVFGLAVGLAGCGLILLHVTDELSFDRFHAREASIRRVMCAFRDGEGYRQRTFSMPVAIAPFIRDYFPEIEHAVRFARQRGTIRSGEVLANEVLTFTDPGLFEVFSFPLRSGDPARVLADESSLVLTETAAARYFGRLDPVGRTVTLSFGDSARDFVVSGVAADPPRNSTIQFRALIRVENLAWSQRFESLTNLSDFSFPLFISMRPGASPDAIEGRLADFVAATYEAEWAKWGEEARTPGHPPIALSLQPLRRMHFDATASDSADPAGVLILSGIALVILLTAGINFVNLSIGRSAARTAEIGLRKVIGAGRPQLIRQFWAESFILVGLAFGAGLALATMVLPAFNRLAGKTFTAADFLQPVNLAGLAALLVAAAAAAGAYPALVLSAVPPVQAFKGRFGWGGRRFLTKALVAFQFALSVFLIISTVVLGRQLRFLITQDPGYIREGLLTVPLQTVKAEEVEPLVERFRNRFGALPGVMGVSASNNAFGRGWSRTPFAWSGGKMDIYQFRVDPHFLETMGVRVAEGRDFSKDPGADAGTAIVNRELCRRLGADEPVGRLLGEFGSTRDEYPYNLRIIGVIEDFNVRSFKDAVQPILLQREPGWGMANMLVRVRTDGLAATLRGLEEAWGDIQPGRPFEYSFVEDDLENQYASEARWSGIVRLSSAFALLIACLGIFGLSLLAVQRRFKEIGIRKVLGSGVGAVVALVGREFIVLAAAANLVAWPAAFLVMRRVLDGYHYRIPLGLPVFLIAGAVSLLAVALTVGPLAAKAALADPVRAIRYE